ncbi:MAG: hypothetical protein QM820_03135 [Minicystis sp.]
MLACHNPKCTNPWVAWNGGDRCPTCSSDKYEVRYVCQNRGCPVFDCGQREYKKTHHKCQYCDANLG